MNHAFLAGYVNGLEEWWADGPGSLIRAALERPTGPSMDGGGQRAAAGFTGG
ncbi:hypothetical protein [Streptomyces rhizosphaericus]|uniref:hypothetical protein n=1 Tax=Streptomyces rhizosphaericus TaxID=114699 RepID=UPI00202E9FA8|nr:hypothetical protein [Streptomyces rhizosphaericus]